MRDIAIRTLHYRINRIFSAKLITLSMLAGMIVFTQAASAQTASADDGRPCSVATLKGQYSWAANAWGKVPDQNDPSKKVTVPSASIALLTLDGNGTFNLLIDFVADGNLVGENIRGSGTYKVNSDCTGVLDTPIGAEFDMLVPRDGSSILLINKAPGVTHAWEAKRIK